MPDTTIQFSQARNGEETCSCGGKYLHSKYNPKAEAQKFVDNIEAEFEPQCVFILEPALSYCADFLRKRFPGASLCAIRFTGGFGMHDGLWDKTFFAKDGLDDELFNAFGEEKLCSAIFADWTPSKNAFPAESELSWRMIRSAVIKSRNVMATRAHFSKRWLKNSAIFAANVGQFSTIKNEKKSSRPILIAASGTSLESSIKKIRENRESFFLIAVSSAFMPLSRNGIEPDFVISTDGGYWAKKHLDFPTSEKSGAALALAIEGAAPRQVLKEKTTIPLLYDDASTFQKRILGRIGIEPTTARRNGTVSGTALELAMAMSDGPIFLCGLDQAPAKGFQHTQPNALETASEEKDTRLSTKETRMTASRFNSAQSLEIYRNWFISNSKRFNTPTERIFRLSDNFPFEFRLGSIRDIDWDEFGRITKKHGAEKFHGEKPIEIGAAKKIDMDFGERKTIIMEELEKALSDEKFLNEVFPMDVLMFKREKDAANKKALEEKIDEKKRELISEIEKTIGK